MTPSKPPALATWMLEHLLWGGRNEALAGDLLEEFRRRRSVAWYWRQVMGAIFASFSNEVRADWVMVWTVVFTIVWGYGLYAIPLIASQLPLPLAVVIRLDHYLVAHGYRGTLIWYGFAYAFGVVLPFLFHVAMPLGLYLVGARNMNFRAFARGLCAAVLLTAALGVVPFQPVLDFLSMHGFAMYWVQLWKWYEVMRQLVPLLGAIWAAQYLRKRSHSSPLLAG
jgi:hypothetical protein